MVWSPTVPEKQVDEETMKRYKLVVEQLIEANFHECMLAQNYNTPAQTHKVSGYIKGARLREACLELCSLAALKPRPCLPARGRAAPTLRRVGSD